jgi:hypothetical protein
MSGYNMTSWCSFASAVTWANIRAKDTGRRQRVECIAIDQWPLRFQVVPAKAPVSA